ncbi:glycoside hydrolase family 27 protein [Mycolicibacterium rhodesiae]|uniref:Alpha-galactosidase n=1 Tax=Mycolicibacterium rhodesiae TaxID=36814 RepID=A0A1X0INB5_MYCRH|nr:glycoside hydrolase family 27 protein [Mycolicibacterium rhodesiae]MCV7343557.1 glycoside hydrolase family 27 protein [Mycolicibacterium rhodesiae]ORB49080.1 alpha-galactosidase [Mycolicibacterium rhodesiae]
MRRLSTLLGCLVLLAAGVAACGKPPARSAPAALTPPMGWNSWNSGISLSERTVEETIDAMVSSGMRDAGYRYVNLDAGWAADSRDSAGDLRADPVRFPGGIPAVAQYAHSHGMLLGLYASPSYELCGLGAANASRGHESADATTFARWGVDYLKYDWCSTDQDRSDQISAFSAMRDALQRSGRQILYSINPNTSGDPSAGSAYDWSGIADMSRTTIDLVPLWHSQTGAAGPVLGVTEQVDADVPLAARSRPGYVNDPDMLVAGISWPDFVADHQGMVETLAGEHGPSMTLDEQRTHISLWAMLAAPLLAGNDIRTMSAQTRDLLTNPDIIAVDQDPLVTQGRPLAQDNRIMVKPLAGGAVAVSMTNPESQPASIVTTAASVGLPHSPCYRVRDLWTHVGRSTTSDLVAEAIPPHATVMMRVRPSQGCH